MSPCFRNHSFLTPYIFLLVLLFYPVNSLANPSLGSSTPQQLQDLLKLVEDDWSLPTTEAAVLPHGERYSKAEVQTFQKSYRSYIQTLSKGNAHTANKEFSKLMQGILDARLARIESKTSLENKAVIQISAEEPTQIYTRPAVTGKKFLIVFGIEFLKNLDLSMLKFSIQLMANYHDAITGWFTKDKKLSDLITVSRLLDLAPQFHVQNLARAGVVSVGGAPRLPWDINILAGDLIASSFVPDDLKKELVETGSPGFLKNPPLDWKELQSEFDDYYRNLYQDMDDTEYIGALHFYILRDVLTYLLSHELGHADLGQFSSHNSQLFSKAGRLQIESSADIRAMEIIARLADTDLRSLILSLAFFIAYQDSIGESDQDHPLPADRVRVMFASAQSLTPSLILDIDAGYSFFADQYQTYKPPAHDKEMYGLPYDQISAFPGVDHSIRFRVQYDRSSYTLSKKSPPEVVLDVSIQLYQVLDPERTPVVAHYRGHVLGQNPLIGQEVAFGPNGTFRGGRPYEAIHVLRLPPDVWTLCPSCGIRIKQLSFLHPQSIVTPTWNAIHRPVQAMLDDLETLLDKGQQPYALLFLARGLYDEHRSDDAGYVYSKISKDYADLLSPADWIKYAATYSPDRAVERAKLLDLAIRRYPTTSLLAMAKGLNAEQGGDALNAFDGYYREKIVSTGSIYEVQSGERIFKLLNEEAAPESPQAILREGFSSYVRATKDCENSNRPPDTSKRLHCAMLFEKASSAFTSIAKISPNFAFLNMAAETTLYYHLYAGLPLHAPEQMLTSLIQKGFVFPVVYKKLVLIAECRRDYKAAQAWFIAAIRNNLRSFHPTLLDMLRLLKHEGTLWCHAN